MKKICNAKTACFFLLAASLSIFCYGENIKVKFSGDVAFVAGLQSTFAIGRPFDVTITYDTETPLAMIFSTVGFYENAVTQFTFNYDNGSYIGAASGLDIYIRNDNLPAISDRFSVYFDGADTVSFPTIDGESLRLDYFSTRLEIVDDDTHTAIDSFELPTTQDFFDSPAFYDHHNGSDLLELGFSYSPSDTSYQAVYLEINNATIIPEPATIILFGAAIPFMLRRRRIHV